MYDNTAQSANAPDRPYLARIGDMADDTQRIANYIDDFISRCRGGGIEAGGDKLAPVPSGHFGQLDRLSNNMARLDALARELQTIG